MRERMYLGLDVGSSGLKGILADAGGNILYQRKVSYDIGQPHPGWAQQDPEIWWDAVDLMLREALKQVSGARDSLRGIYITSMVPNLVPLDQAGRAVRPAILYRDNRAVRECRELNSRHGLSLNMQDVVPKWFWLKTHEPQQYEKTAMILGTHSFLVYRLTGRATADADIAGLMGRGIFSRESGWNRDLLSQMGLDPDMLPEVLEPGDLAGTVREDLARQLGLTVPVPVFAGNGDSLASLLGTAAVRENDAMIYLGTAATVWHLAREMDQVAPNGIFDPEVLTFAGNTLTGGELIRWYRYGLQLDGTEHSFGELEAGAREIGPGADGLMVLPHFMGKRTPEADPLASGVFFGLTPTHTGIHIYRALMEAVALNLKDSVDASGKSPSRLLITGGGAASSLWRQIFADVFGMDVYWYPKGDGALGTAYFAGYCLGDFQGFRELEEVWMGPVEISRPDPSVAQQYREILGAYRELDRAMAPVFARLHEKKEAGQ